MNVNKKEKTMPDDKQGKIYTDRCETDDTLIDVGCTTQTLCVIMAKHKYSSIQCPNICFFNMSMIGMITYVFDTHTHTHTHTKTHARTHYV
jgi:hypothetical protein